jgi:UDP-N-acetylglucosamine--N-acetylmuramyl-(pentapeptide) pyrophosphoryl-undecaprenol N-acetylglucosamine transferase
VFCKGGYVALPVVLAARILRKRIIVHESDTHSGLVNKMAARFADRIFTGFDNVLPGSETVGQILSDDIAFGDDTTAIKDAKISEILAKIPKKKTIVLVIGGSQ